MENASGKSASFIKRMTAWLALLLIIAAVLAVVVIPVYVIAPFKAQTERGLELSYALRRLSPVITVAGLLISLALTVWLWRNSRRWWRKTALVLAIIINLAAVWFARQNHFEWMFKPLPRAEYAKVSEAGFVADSDMVLSVENNGEAVAYPVRQMAYHHLVQDVVGGTPIVATY
jgi:Protein of unknown function (DUF3179)